MRFDQASASESSTLAPPGASRKIVSKTPSPQSSPGVSPQTPRKKPTKKLAKLKGGAKGSKPKLLQKFKLAAQKVNKAQEYIEKTR